MNWEALSRDFSRCREGAASFKFASYCCALRARSPKGELIPLLLAQGHWGDRPARMVSARNEPTVCSRFFVSTPQ